MSVLFEPDGWQICEDAEEDKTGADDDDRDLEAESLRMAEAAAGGGIDKGPGTVVPSSGGQQEDETLKEWPSPCKLKGQPGLLSATVKIEHLRLHTFFGGGDEGLAELRLLAANDRLNELSYWRARRQRRYFILGFMAVCLQLILPWRVSVFFCEGHACAREDKYASERTCARGVARTDCRSVVLCADEPVCVS